MGVSKNRGTQKWMVYKALRENPIEMDDLGGFPIFLETPIYNYPITLPAGIGIHQPAFAPHLTLVASLALASNHL